MVLDRASHQSHPGPDPSGLGDGDPSPSAPLYHYPRRAQGGAGGRSPMVGYVFFQLLARVQETPSMSENDLGVRVDDRRQCGARFRTAVTTEGARRVVPTSSCTKPPQACSTSARNVA